VPETKTTRQRKQTSARNPKAPNGSPLHAAALKRAVRTLSALLLLATTCFSQSNFVVTGSAIPDALLKLNYGPLPKTVHAFDLNLCNITATKQSVVSSAIYQALAESNPGLQPIGRAIMLAAILRNQNHSVSTILNTILSSATSILSVVGTVKSGLPSGLLTGAALGSLAAQQLIGNLKPVLTADQVEKFEAQALESALVLDGGSCVERTMFATLADPAAKTKSMSFHVR
jgi:hypothetical protein